MSQSSHSLGLDWFQTRLGINKSLQFDLDTDPTASAKASLPHLKKKGSRYKYRNTKFIKNKIEKATLSYKKRSPSQKVRSSDVVDLVTGYQTENFTKGRHLLNNASPNYLELNQMVMQKLRLHGRANTEMESNFKDKVTFHNTMKYKFGTKGSILVRFFK